MLKTEAQAKACWCPMGRSAVHTDDGPVTVNDASDFVPKDNRTNCIASGCMMWREVHSDNHPTLGYCGLAGSTGLEFPAGGSHG